MDDTRIVELYFARDEQAIAETAQKYGPLCHRIATDILACREDAEECVNDTYLRAWNAIPPARPHLLSAFLAKITRNLALTRYREQHREKRGEGQLPLALDELQNCLPPAGGESLTDDIALRHALNQFVKTLPEPSRTVFLQRYWYVRPVADIARELGLKESRVKMMLLRTRERLREHLQREGIEV